MSCRLYLTVGIVCQVHVLCTDVSEALGGSGRNREFSVSSPDPDVLVWDKTRVGSVGPRLRGFRVGWLQVPVVHNRYVAQIEESPTACLRVMMKPANRQPALLGPILTHCGGPQSTATCADTWYHKWFSVSSQNLTGPALGDDYDVWGISQRGVDQDPELTPKEPNTRNFSSMGWSSKCPFKDANGNDVPVWPKIVCNNVRSSLYDAQKFAEIRRIVPETYSDEEIKEFINGPKATTFGIPYLNERYIRLNHIMSSFESNRCYNEGTYKMRSSSSGRSFNLLDYVGTRELANDIEVFRRAVGAKKMSVFGVSYGTKVGSVYATLFPDSIHRLIIDGNMGSDPDVEHFTKWNSQAVEAVWTGLAESCDNSALSGLPKNATCCAGPRVSSKVSKLMSKQNSTREEATNAMMLWWAMQNTLRTPDVPCAPELMTCIADPTTCGFDKYCHKVQKPRLRYLQFGGNFFAWAILGQDLAGRLTEEAAVALWRTESASKPLGVSMTWSNPIGVMTWPAVPRPQPPVGNPTVAPLVIGNLFDGTTPYTMAQRMEISFPSGSLLTTHFYGHGAPVVPHPQQVVDKYYGSMLEGVTPEFTLDVAKLLCMKVVHEFVKFGKLQPGYVCVTPGPAVTWPCNAQIPTETGSHTSLMEVNIHNDIDTDIGIDTDTDTATDIHTDTDTGSLSELAIDTDPVHFLQKPVRRPEL